MKKNLEIVMPLLLGMFYCFVLALSVFGTKVSTAYKMYYITGEMDQYVDEKELNNYTCKKKYELKSGTENKNLGRGWSYPEETGTWCIGDRSDVIFYIDDGKDHEMIIRISGDIGYTNDLYVNNQYVSTLHFDGNCAKIAIDKNLIKIGLNVFSIIPKEEVKPLNELWSGTDDARSLNLMVNDIELKDMTKSGT